MQPAVVAPARPPPLLLALASLSKTETIARRQT